MEKITQPLVCDYQLDSAFYAIAAGIIDKALVKPSTYAPLIARLSKCHQKYFVTDNQLHFLATTSVHNRFENLIQSAAFSQCIHELSYLLRQIAVDEICNHCTEYPLAFNEIEPSQMRLSNQWFHETAIAALAHVLQIPISVYQVAGAKNIAKNRRYGSHVQDTVFDVLELQADAQLYSTLLMRLQATIMLATAIPLPQLKAHLPAPSLASILNQLRAFYQQLECQLLGNHAQLQTLVVAGVYDKESLFTLYQLGIKTEKNGSRLVNNLHLKQGSDALFAQLSPSLQLNSFACEGYDNQIVHLLITAVARQLTLGELNAQQVLVSEALITENLETSSIRRWQI